MKEMKGVASVAIAIVIIVLVIAAAAVYIYLRPVEEEEEIATLQYWHTMSPHEETKARELLDEFEAANPGIRVEMESVPYGEMRVKLITAVAAGMAPDIVRMDIAWLPEYADMGALMELDDYIAEAGMSSDDFYPGPWLTCIWEGKMHGMPLNTCCEVLAYRKSLLKAAGVSVPTTWSELLDAAKKLTLDKDGDGVTDQWGLNIGGAWSWHIMPFVWQAGGAELNPDMTKCVLNEAPAVEALKFLSDLIHVYKVMPATPDMWGDSIGMLARGEAAMIFGGPWIKGMIEGMDPAAWPDVGVAVRPKGPAGGGQACVGGEDIVIFKQSKNPDAAWKVVEYMMGKHYQVGMAEVGVWPTLRAAGDDPAVSGDPFCKVFMDQLKDCGVRAVHPAYGEMNVIFHTYYEAILMGEMTPEAGLDALVAEIDELL